MVTLAVVTSEVAMIYGGGGGDFGGDYGGDYDDILDDIDDTLGDIETKRSVIIEINYD